MAKMCVQPIEFKLKDSIELVFINGKVRPKDRFREPGGIEQNVAKGFQASAQNAKILAQSLVLV